MAFTCISSENNEYNNMLIDMEKIGNVRLIKMKNEPENRLSFDLLDNINNALDEIEADKSARSVVITGSNEKYFSTGLDIAGMMVMPFEDRLKSLLTYVDLLHRVFLFPKPVVSAINGHAIAGGFFISLATDWRVMREDRGFVGIPEIDLGVDLPTGHLALVVYAIGTRVADYLSISGERVPAPEALRMGAIDRMAPMDEVVPIAIEKARKLGTKAPDLYARYKCIFRKEPADIIKVEDPKYMRNLVESLDKASSKGK